MAEYIKREAALAICEEEYREQLRILNYAGDSVAWDIGHAIKELPAVDVAPVVHGRWGTGRFNLETGNYEEQCTRCRNFSKEYGKPYCPNCGAKMNEKEAVYD